MNDDDSKNDTLHGRRFWIIWAVTLTLMTGFGTLLGASVNKALFFGIVYLLCGSGFLFLSLRKDIEQPMRRTIQNVILVILVFFPLIIVFAFPR